MTQYAVAFFPDSDLSVRLVGPFRTHEKARSVCDRLDAAFSAAADRNEGFGAPGEAAPQVVYFITEAEALNWGEAV